MRRLMPRVATVLALFLCLACGPETPVTPSVPQGPDLSATPMPDEEAEIAAMVLSRELVAPKWLYDRIRTDLMAIRAQFMDSFPAVGINFLLDWKPSNLGMQIDQVVFFDTVSGGGRIFDSLNQIYRLDTIDWLFDDFYRLAFEGRLNSVRLADIYSGIPGAYGAWPFSTIAGDHPRLVIWPDGKTFKYFFRDAWGDCPSGCMHSAIYYFTSYKGRFAYIGSVTDTTDPRPNWTDTMMMATDTSLYYYDWCRGLS